MTSQATGLEAEPIGSGCKTCTCHARGARGAAISRNPVGFSGNPQHGAKTMKWKQGPTSTTPSPMLRLELVTLGVRPTAGQRSDVPIWKIKPQRE
jgi:hypothetical protein